MFDATNLNSSAEGHRRCATSANSVVPSADEPLSSDAGQDCAASSAIHWMPVSEETIVTLRGLHRERRFVMEQRKRLDLSLGAFLRRALGWQKDLPEAERKAIAKRASDIVKNPAGTPWEPIVNANDKARREFDRIETDALKGMERLAKTLPVWPTFGEPIRGFGAASLAVIVAEAGDLSAYSSHSKLWKRMGLAVMDGVRQGGLKKGAGADAWIDHGYSPSRRSLMWNIGDALVNKGKQIKKVLDANGEDTGEREATGPYGAIYLTRKVYERERNPEMSPMQIHRRAQRYVEKRLLRDLWQAWRGREHRAEGLRDMCPASPLSESA